ncbi:NUDIX domain-containing protein [Roseomonas sp. GCM10028921]
MTDQIPMADAYGGVLVSRTGKVLLREPSGHFGGYVWTFARGRPRKGESPADAALREVRKETGYEVEITALIPRVFAGTTTTTAFFLMGPRGSQKSFNSETSATRWVTFEEAEQLIAETKTKSGRERDLTVLRAAQNAMKQVPYMQWPATCKDDWTTTPLPDRRTGIVLNLPYSDAAMERIRRGFLPASMEDRWFAWFEDDLLYLHRSWTGYCYYQVIFEREGEDWRAAWADLNRDPAQYENTDDEWDRTLILDVIDNLLVNGLTEPQVDPMVQALTAAMQPNYLGSTDVVSDLLLRALNAYIARFKQKIEYDDVMAVINDICKAFVEDEAGYVRMPNWHTRNALGSALVTSFNLDEDYCRGEGLYFVISESLASFWLHIGKMLKAFAADPKAKWDPDALLQINCVHAFARDVFLGTNTVTFPGKTLADFPWVPVRPVTDADGLVA